MHSDNNSKLLEKQLKSETGNPVVATGNWNVSITSGHICWILKTNITIKFPHLEKNPETQ